MKPYSVDLGERLLGAIDAGLSQAEAAHLFGVGTATIEHWRRRQRESGGVAPLSRTGRPRRIGPQHVATLAAQVRTYSDATLGEHCAHWEVEHGMRLSTATMSRLVAQLGWPLKEAPDRQRTRRGGTRRLARQRRRARSGQIRLCR